LSPSKLCSVATQVFRRMVKNKNIFNNFILTP
jgi:hypothetical protein